ncbi:unnamed protein product, partial [Sphenostylis stenocarpa]
KCGPNLDLQWLQNFGVPNKTLMAGSLNCLGKVEQIAEEAESLRASLDKYNLRNLKRLREANERAELLGRANGDSAHVLRIFDEEGQALQSVRSSSRELENANAIGEAILSSIHGQRERLKVS